MDRTNEELKPIKGKVTYTTPKPNRPKIGKTIKLSRKNNRPIR
jgi:hypothetical protein